MVGYERSLAPEMLPALDRYAHLGEMIGAGAGIRVQKLFTHVLGQIEVENFNTLIDK